VFIPGADQRRRKGACWQKSLIFDVPFSSFFDNIKTLKQGGSWLRRERGEREEIPSSRSS